VIVSKILLIIDQASSLYDLFIMYIKFASKSTVKQEKVLFFFVVDGDCSGE